MPVDDGSTQQDNRIRDPNAQKELKLVLVGDTSVGKSCLITNFLKNSFTEDYEPTVLDVYRGTKNVNAKQVEIELHDTSGDEHLGVNRKVQYQDADCFMICVACNMMDSFENIGKWKAEIQEVEQQKPIMLILTKSDLKDEVDEPVLISMLRKASKEQSFQGAMSTSSKAWEDFNVHKAFNKALTTAYMLKYDDQD